MQMETNKQARDAILVSPKIDFKTRAVTIDQEGHFIMIKGSTQEEDITPINIYIPNIGATKYTKQKLVDIKGEINSKDTNR